MFIHNFKYSLKTLFRNKALIFWTFAFPIILGTFFSMAFSNIENNEKLDVMNIAVVDNESFKTSEIYQNTFKTLSDKTNKDRLFQIKYVDEKEAKELLEDDKIIGYMILENDLPTIVIKDNGIDQTIFKYVTEEIAGTNNMIKNLSEEEIKKEMIQGNNHIDYEKIYSKINELVQRRELNIIDISNKNMNYVMIEFYTLIAMTCLYGGILSMVSINQNLANMSNNGKRVSVAPTSKTNMILSSVCASYITQLIGLMILFIYTIFALHVDYGNHMELVILLSLVGSLAGLSIGVFVGTIFKTNDSTKTGVLLAFTMLGCFLSGMMGISMKYIVDKNIPIINKINPASMITDGFYALYYYNTLDRYYNNVICLLVFSFILIFLSFMSLRRQKYDSI